VTRTDRCLAESERAAWRSNIALKYRPTNVPYGSTTSANSSFDNGASFIRDCVAFRPVERESETTYPTTEQVAAKLDLVPASLSNRPASRQGSWFQSLVPSAFGTATRGIPHRDQTRPRREVTNGR